MDEIGDHCDKWNKSNTERQTLYAISHMWRQSKDCFKSWTLNNG